MARPKRNTRSRRPAGGDEPLPPGLQDYADLQAALDDVENMSVEEFRAFIDDNLADFTPTQLAELQEFAQSQATYSDDPTDPQWSQASSVLTVAIDEGADEGAEVIEEQQATVDEQASDDDIDAAVDAVAEVLGRTAPGIAPDLAGIEELSGLSTADRNEAINQARAQAVEERAGEIQGSTGASEDEATALAQDEVGRALDLDDATEPDWLLQFNQGFLSEQQKRRYVDYWNDAYGTYLRDFDTELAPILARFDGTEEEAQNFANAVLADQEPLISHSIELPLVQGSRRVSYTQEELEDLRSMGFSNDAVTRLVRLSAFQSGGSDAIRPGAAGDTLRVGPLAMLTRYHGGGAEFGAFTQSQQDIADLEQQLGLDPGEWNGMTAKERQKFRRRFEGTRGVSGITVRDPKLEIVDRLESATRARGMREDRGVLPGILAANNNFKRGMDMYRGDEFLSFVHAVDPALAQRVAATGGDPDRLEWQDNAAVYDILERGGVIEGSNTRLRQLESATGFFGYFNTGRGARGGGGGGAGPVRRLVDPAAVKEQVQQLWSRMFLADVDDATVQAVTANLQKQLDDAPEGMSFDVSARIMAFLRGQDVYDELYRNKPEGLSEEEFQAQFAGGVSDMLGNELDPEALKAGMRTGDYQTAVGRAATSGKLLTNSTLRGRWAQAKQVLDRFT